MPNGAIAGHSVLYSSSFFPNTLQKNSKIEMQASYIVTS